MIEKQKGIASSDYISFDNREYDEKYGCDFMNNEAYGFLFDGQGNILFTDKGGVHKDILHSQFGIDIFKNEESKKEAIDFLFSHTNGRIFVDKGIMVSRYWNLITKKEMLKLIDETKKKLDIDLSKFIYCICDTDSEKQKKQQSYDMYLIKVKDYIEYNLTTLHSIKSKYKQLEKSRLQPADDRYDSFDIAGKNGKKLGVGRLGYHMLAYQESKKHNIKKFDEFLKENKKRRLD